jgi:mono/diheme cytochrome c family protein
MRNFPRSLIILALMTQASNAEPLTYALPEETAALRPGPGMETARDICMSCHSVDYINTQPPRSGKEFWEGEVKKMIKSYHASISEADAETIADYLAKTY